MKYILTEEEYKNLAGNKEALEADYSNKLKQSVENFRLDLMKIVSKFEIPPQEQLYNRPLDAMVTALKQAMKNVKLLEPSRTSQSSPPAVADNS